MAAELNTLVVSWNDGTDPALCTGEAFVIPSNKGEDVAVGVRRDIYQRTICPSYWMNFLLFAGA